MCRTHACPHFHCGAAIAAQRDRAECDAVLLDDGDLRTPRAMSAAMARRSRSRGSSPKMNDEAQDGNDENEATRTRRRSF